MPSYPCRKCNVRHTTTETWVARPRCGTRFSDAPMHLVEKPEREAEAVALLVSLGYRVEFEDVSGSAVIWQSDIGTTIWDHDEEPQAGNVEAYLAMVKRARATAFEEAVAKVLGEGCDVETESAYAFPDPEGEPYFTVLNCTGDHSELDGHYEDATDAARAFVAIEKEGG